MNPLCPRCHAELEDHIAGDLLTCPSCDYSHGGVETFSLSSPRGEPDEDPVYIG